MDSSFMRCAVWLDLWWPRPAVSSRRGPSRRPVSDVISDRFVGTDAGADLLKALLDAVLDDLHRFRRRLLCGRCALLGSLDGDLEHLPREFGLQRNVLVNLTERLVLACPRPRLAQSRFQRLALLLRLGLSALRGHLRTLAEGVDVLLLGLEQLVNVQLRQPEIAAELPQHVDV